MTATALTTKRGLPRALAGLMGRDPGAPGSQGRARAIEAITANMARQNARRDAVLAPGLARPPATSPAMDRVRDLVGAITQGGIKMPASAASRFQWGQLSAKKSARYITQPKTTEPGRRPIATTSRGEYAFSAAAKLVREWIAAHPEQAGPPDAQGRYLNVPMYRNPKRGYWRGYLTNGDGLDPITDKVYIDFQHRA